MTAYALRRIAEPRLLLDPRNVIPRDTVYTSTTGCFAYFADKYELILGRTAADGRGSMAVFVGAIGLYLQLCGGHGPHGPHGSYAYDGNSRNSTHHNFHTVRLVAYHVRVVKYACALSTGKWPTVRMAFNGGVLDLYNRAASEKTPQIV